MPKITVGPWRMRNGDKVIVTAIDAPGRDPVKGHHAEVGDCIEWASDGCWTNAESFMDLIAPWQDEPKLVKHYLWAFSMGKGSWWDSGGWHIEGKEPKKIDGCHYFCTEITAMLPEHV